MKEVNIAVTPKILAEIESYPEEKKQELIDHIRVMSRDMEEILDKIEPPRKQLFFFYKLLDKLIEKDLKGLKIPCKNGCSKCCYMNVSVSKEEIKLLAELIKSGAWYNKKEFERQKGLTTEVREKKAMRCIFLKGSQCSIYDLRPASCRKFYVAEKDNSKCDVNDNFRVAMPTMLSSEIAYMAYRQVNNEVGDGNNSLAAAVGKELMKGEE